MIKCKQPLCGIEVTGKARNENNIQVNYADTNYGIYCSSRCRSIDISIDLLSENIKVGNLPETVIITKDGVVTKNVVWIEKGETYE